MARTVPVPPEPDARLQRSWRRASLAYAVVLTAGTHWPNLRFGAEMPASDKTVHLLAFAGLTVLVARTGWVSSPWRAGLVVGLWSILDELTQALPGLGRDVGPPDMVANLLGCLLAAAWLRAIGPAGGPPARWRHAMLRATLDRVLAAAWPWLLAAGLGGLTWATYAVMRRFDPPLPTIAGLDRVRMERGLVLLTAILAAHAGVLAVMRAWQRSVDRAHRRGICVACGRDLQSGEAPTSLEPGTCSGCGRTTWAAASLQSSPVRAAAMLRAVRRPAVVTAAAFALAAAVVFTTPYAVRAAVGTPVEPAADLLRRGLMAVPATLETSIDLTIAGLLLAAATAWTRRRLAAAFDHPVTCRGCGQDLRGTPAPGGVGRCAECGEVFLRMEATR